MELFHGIVQDYMDIKEQTKENQGEQGWMAQWYEHSPPRKCDPGFDSQTRHHMWVEFDVISLVCSERIFASGTPVFPSPQKATFLNSNSIQNAHTLNTHMSLQLFSFCILTRAISLTLLNISVKGTLLWEYQ